MDINFIFIRHGESCHNLFKKYPYDPILTDKGVMHSINSGKMLYKKLKRGIYNTDQRGHTINVNIPIEEIDIIGCSPTLRAMETSIHMSKPWSPSDIYVFPYLRECFCTENDTIESVNYSFPILPNNKQMKYIKTLNESVKINDNYIVDNERRERPGNIKKFIAWFIKNVDVPDKKVVNVLVFIHSNVIGAFTGSKIHNNNGFILQTMNYARYKKDTYPLLDLRMDYSKTIDTRCSKQKND